MSESITTEIFCMLCKKKVKPVKPYKCLIRSKGGSTRSAIRGHCPVCGRGVFKIIKSV